MVGSTTLESGESTTIQLPLFMGMHAGMGGPHDFAIDIVSDDPVSPVTTVHWRFDIV